MKPSQTHLPIARFGKVYGIKGWIKVHSYTDPPEQILKYKQFFLDTKNGWEVLDIDGFKPHAKGFIVHIKGFDVPEASQAYVSKTIGIAREELPELPENEYYWKELEGLLVINQSGVTLGVIDHLIEGATHDVIVVKGEKKHLIPYAKQYVLNIDLAQNQMQVDWELDWS